MPRRYHPVLSYEDYTWEPYADMKESKYGEYVKLKTFEDTVAMLTAANIRLQKELHKLKNEPTK